jgi:damage-control phosphatase, subfamily I
LIYGGLEDITENALKSPLVINHYEQFLAGVNKSNSLLYIGDQVGETVFDRVLIEELSRIRNLDIHFVVRDMPIINDATIADALAAGLDKVAGIISSGSDAPATILTQCLTEMLSLINSSDVIIAKGQGNYETLKDEPGNSFFFLRAKCSLVSQALKVNIGDAILKHSLTEA